MHPQYWHGVDLDGTLAYYDQWVSEEHIGEPIPAMVERVKAWRAAGDSVKILTARVSHGDSDRITSIIQDWTEKHIGERLPVTCVKDYLMVDLWDDRAVSVECNTGRITTEGRE